MTRAQKGAKAFLQTYNELNTGDKLQLPGGIFEEPNVLRAFEMLGIMQADEDLKRYLFDFLLFHWYEQHQEDPRFFDSKEWLQIEDASIDEGSELFNILFYLFEAAEENINPGISDFIQDFLMLDDTEAEQLLIYEPVIKNSDLTGEDIANSKNAAKQLKDHELQDIFLPLMLMFNDEMTEDRMAWIKKEGTPAEAAVFAGIEGFYFES